MLESKEKGGIMTVASESTKISYNCDGARTEFSYPYKAFADEDIAVYLVETAADTITLLALTTDYTVTGDMVSGCVVTTTVTYSNAYTITLKLNLSTNKRLI